MNLDLEYINMCIVTSETTQIKIFKEIINDMLGKDLK